MMRWTTALSLSAMTMLVAGGAAAAESFTVTSISRELGGSAPGILSVPSVDVTESNLDEAAVRRIFAEGVAGSATALAGLDAKAVTIPLITVSTKNAAVPLLIVRDISLQNVADGKAGTVSVGGAEFVFKPGQQFELGSVSARDLNVAALLGFYGLVDLPDRETLQQVYAGLDIGTMGLQSSDISCTVEPIHFGKLEARPLRPGSMATMLRMQARPDEQDPTPDEIVAGVKMYVDILTAYRVEGGEYGGFHCTGTEDGKPFAMSFGKVAQGQGTPGATPTITYSDIAIAPPEASVRIGNMVLKPIDFSGPIAAVKEQGEALGFAWITANYRKLIPAVAGFSLADISADVPDPSAPGKRTKGSLGSFDLTLGDYVNGIPAAISASLRGLHVELPATPENQQLIAMGYNNLDVGADVGIHWDKANSTLVVDRLATTWQDAGSTVITAVLGNAPSALFAEDPAVAMRAWQGLTLKELTLDLSDEGLLGKALAIAATEQSMEPQAFRSAMAAMAQGTVIVGLAGNADSVAVSQAITSFILGDSPHIRITATALDPAGISLADLEATQESPTALLQKVKVVAVADAASPPAPPVEAPAPPAPPVTTNVEPLAPSGEVTPPPPTMPETAPAETTTTTPESSPASTAEPAPASPDTGATSDDRRIDKNAPAPAGQ